MYNMIHNMYFLIKSIVFKHKLCILENVTNYRTRHKKQSLDQASGGNPIKKHAEVAQLNEYQASPKWSGKVMHNMLY